MKRFAFLSLLLVPSAVGAQQHAPVHSAPYPGQDASVGAAIDQGLAQYDQRPMLSQPCETGCPTHFNTACGHSGGWFGDIGFYILRPQWGGGNPAFATTVVTEDIDGFATATTQTDFDHDYNFAPLVQIGYAGRNGLGVRGRWWTLRSTETVGGAFAGDADADVFFSTPSLLGTGGIGGEAFVDGDFTASAGGDFRNRLSLDVIDLESIWETRLGRSSLLFSAGVRYAHIGQTYDGNVTQTFEELGLETIGTASLRSNNTFNGAGPTVSAQAYRMIGNTNLSVYGLSRGSLLFGESRQQAFSDFAVSDDLGLIFADSATASLTSNSVRPVMELEVGTNWTRNMGAYDLFVENGLVGMMWFNAGNAANTDAIIGGGDFGTIGADNANQNLGLLGLRFSTGVRF